MIEKDRFCVTLTEPPDPAVSVATTCTFHLHEKINFLVWFK